MFFEPGVSVSQLGLGAMMFGAWGNPDHDDSIQIIHAALDAGINFIDTADVYARGESEEMLGKALAGRRRGDVILATKFYGLVGDDPNQQGKVRYIGSSTFPASQMVEAQRVARKRNLQRFVTEQPAYSILARAIEADVLPTATRHGMGVLSYSPLTGSWLSGRWRKDAGQVSSSRAGRLPERFDITTPDNQRKLDAVEQLWQLADETGITLVQLAIAFVLNHPAITAAIIGPRTMQQLDSQLAATEVTLDTAVLDRVDEIVAPGTTINPVDNSFENPALSPTTRRR